MTKTPPTRLVAPTRGVWLGLLLCLAALFVAAPAKAHVVHMSSDPAAAAVVLLQALVSAALPDEAEDRSCPGRSGHAQHHNCASAGLCYAVALTPAVAVAPRATTSRFAVSPVAATDGRDVAPLFHPPRSRLRS